MPAAPKSAERSARADRKSTRLNSSHSQISYAVFCLKKKKLSADRVHVNELIADSLDEPLPRYVLSIQSSIAYSHPKHSQLPPYPSTPAHTCPSYPS